jgi:hypothetical protein
MNPIEQATSILKRKMAEKVIVDREELMAQFNNDLGEVVNKHTASLKPYEMYLVMVKLTDDIFREWRKSLKEE